MGHDSPVVYTHWCPNLCFGWYKIKKCVYLIAASHRFELSSDVPTNKVVSLINGLWCLPFVLSNQSFCFLCSLIRYDRPWRLMIQDWTRLVLICCY